MSQSANIINDLYNELYKATTKTRAITKNKKFEYSHNIQVKNSKENIKSRPDDKVSIINSFNHSERSRNVNKNSDYLPMKSAPVNRYHENKNDKDITFSINSSLMNTEMKTKKISNLPIDKRKAWDGKTKSSGNKSNNFLHFLFENFALDNCSNKRENNENTQSNIKEKKQLLYNTMTTEFACDQNNKKVSSTAQQALADTKKLCHSHTEKTSTSNKKVSVIDNNNNNNYIMKQIDKSLKLTISLKRSPTQSTNNIDRESVKKSSVNDSFTASTKSKPQTTMTYKKQVDKKPTQMKTWDTITENNNDDEADAETVNPQMSIEKKVLYIASDTITGWSENISKKENQDSFFIHRKYLNNPWYYFIGVCDGHGSEGKTISSYISNNIPKHMNEALWNYSDPLDDLCRPLISIIKKIFTGLNCQILSQQSFDSSTSGSTMTSALVTDKCIMTFNVGDSRIVLGRYNKKTNRFYSKDLTVDHKWTDLIEKERILCSGGRVFANKDENGNDWGPERIWLKNMNLPGLAMSRSFGDSMAAQVGVISEPECSWFKYTEEDKFIIIASDGIWEYVTSEESVEIVGKFYMKHNYEGACIRLSSLAQKRWVEEGSVDDITLIIVFFE